MKLEDHPTVRRVRLNTISVSPTPVQPLTAEWLKQQVMEAGADDVGFVDIANAALDDQRAHILKAFPRTKTLISYVMRMNREAIRTPSRSVANTEFHTTGHDVDKVGHQVVRRLEDSGIRAMNPAMGFPMEMDQYPGRIWVVSHKPVAVAAGLGKMGVHRNVIHPKFGNFILLGTILIEAAVSHDSKPLDYNPCLDCMLCVAACPVGAISTDGSFNFATCVTHNYREFMAGFTDWVETVADSKSAKDYRSRVSDSESASIWQSLSFGANYKAAYCLSVCPAGEDVIAPFLADRKGHISQIVRPLQDKNETLYIARNTDAEEHIVKRFPHKRIKHVRHPLRINSVAGFLGGLPLVFQPGRSKGLAATYHFTFTGLEQRTATIIIRDESIRVIDGLEGKPDLRIQADSATWVGYLRRERNLLWALLRRKVRLSGSPALLRAFGKCFPE